MNIQDKSREELLKELLELQQENQTLKTSYRQNIAERKQAEDALRMNEENYRLLLELAPVAFFQGDETGNIIMANKKATLISGYTNEELLNMNLRDLFSKTVLNQKPLRYDLLDKGEAVSLEREISCKDHSIKTVEMNSRKMPNNTYQSFMRDISEQKQAEAALRDSEHLYRTVFENTGTSSIIIEEDTTITLTNTEWVNLAGYGREEMEGKMSWTQFVVPEDLVRMVEYHKTRRVEPGNAPRKYEFRFVRKNGEIRNMINCVAIIPESKKSIASLMDITELKQAEESLREREVQLNTIIETSPDGIAITSLEGTIQFATQKVLSLWGYDSANEVLGKNMIDFVHPNYLEKAQNAITELINGKQMGAEEFLMIRKDKSQFFCESNANILHDPANNPIGILFVNRDITERKEVENELIKAKDKAEESDRLKTSFLHNISHEIRTPMNAIVGFSEFLKEPNIKTEKASQFADIIIQSSNQLLSIITDIISIATIEAGQDKVVENEIELNATLKHLHAQFLMNATKQNLVLNLAPFPKEKENWILTDETKLLQVLTNLIVNALKFTKEGSVSIGYLVKEHELLFSVEDTGIGIPAEMHEEIFKRFRQVESTIARQFGGSGLGLSISKSYIEMLGGRIWLDSEPGKGSKFYFTIPYKKIHKVALIGNKFSINAVFETNEPKTLLIVEDEESNFSLLEAFLYDLNMNIIKANNGLEAVEISKSDRKIDLVLMDIKMPVMDGFEATRQIKILRPELKVIAQTAYSEEVDKDKALSAGCIDFICKPIKREHLLAKIKEHLNLSGQPISNIDK